MDSFLAVFWLGGGEIILILALILIIAGARHLPDKSKGMQIGANMITILLLLVLGMVILSLFAR